MRDPPDGQKEDHQVAIEVANLRDGAALDVPAAALGILEGGFHTHAPSIDFDQLTGGRQSGNHDPELLIARLPTQSQRGRKALFLPD